MKPDDGNSAALAPGLYLVSTPIGHLRDISLRALDVLRSVAVIACEDRRVTGKLLAAHGIATPTTPYHEHNAATARPGLLRRLERGEAVALVSDAGTPLISDPGYKLVAEARKAGVAIIPIPGASSVLAALCVSGLPTDRFHFAGFLPARSAARRTALAALAGLPATLILLESPRRLSALLADAAAVLGPRPAAICRELTKIYEEVLSGPLDRLAETVAANPPRGEIVLVIDRAGADTQGGEQPEGEKQAMDDRLARAMESQSLRDAVDSLAAESGMPRNLLYRRALALKEGPSRTSRPGIDTKGEDHSDGTIRNENTPDGTTPDGGNPEGGNPDTR